MNKSGNENRSVRNTKRRLKEGLLHLLEEKSINQITVRELTELVDVNRGTFYFHYTDIFDMLHQIEDDYFEQFSQVLNKEILTGREDIPFIRDIFAFIKDNEKMTRILLGKNTDIEFVVKLKRLLLDRCILFWKQSMDKADDNELLLYSAFIVAGCVGVIKKWLDDGLKETPEEIARLAGTIIDASLVPYFHKGE